jgi:hypothetical protein
MVLFFISQLFVPEVSRLDSFHHIHRSLFQFLLLLVTLAVVIPKVSWSFLVNFDNIRA